MFFSVLNELSNFINSEFAYDSYKYSGLGFKVMMIYRFFFFFFANNHPKF